MSDLIDINAVLTLCRVAKLFEGRATLYRRMAGEGFPRPVEGENGVRSLWSRAEVVRWIELEPLRGVPRERVKILIELRRPVGMTDTEKKRFAAKMWADWKEANGETE